jgi:glycosyltransferase involved in cell wall biosynthesis
MSAAAAGATPLPTPQPEGPDTGEGLERVLAHPYRVSVVIPALNEAENLRVVLPRLGDDYEIVLVDGGSDDGTVEAARSLRPDIVVVQQQGRGKGNALACGFAAASGDIIVMLDADGSARPEEIPSFVKALAEGADFAKGSRFLAGGGSADITRVRRAGNWLLGQAVNILFGTRYTDLCYGFNAVWASSLERLGVDCDGFEVETLMNIRAARAGCRVVEVPSYEDLRLHGASKLHTFRDGWRILRTIVAERVASSQPVVISVALVPDVDEPLTAEALAGETELATVAP